MSKFQKNILIILVILCLITPLGIFLPMWFDAGDAWGEWSAETLREFIGYVPKGMEKYTEVWKSPLPDYTFDSKDDSVVHQSGYYIVSGLFGATICYVFMILISKLMIRNGK